MLKGIRLWLLPVAIVLAASPHGVRVWSEEDTKDHAPADDRALFNEMYRAIRGYLGPDEVLVPPHILAKAEIGDHFETINPDREDTGDAFGNPDARIFGRETGSDKEESDGGTFGKRNGGGRRLMVTRRSYHLTSALMECMRHGLDRKPSALTEPQAKVLAKAIRDLGSEDFREREGASQAILLVGAAGLATLKETLKANRDPEVSTRVRGLLREVALLDVLARFKADPQEFPLPGESRKPLPVAVKLADLRASIEACTEIPEQTKVAMWALLAGAEKRDPSRTIERTQGKTDDTRR